jgi:ethanolamine permease
MQTLVRDILPTTPDFLWWLLFYAVFVAINVRGVELTLKVGLAVTVIAIAVLLVFYVSALVSGAFRWELLFNVEPEEGQSVYWLPKGWFGVFACLPYAIWFYLAIEQLPLAAEETHDVARDMPKALILGIVTLLALSLLTLVLNSGVDGGAAEIGVSGAPLAKGFEAVFGIGAASRLLTLVALAGLIASFHTIIYAYGRVLFALSRAGYIPRSISLTCGWHTPHVALILGAVVGLGCTVVLDYTDATSAAGAALLNMAVFGAVISYTMVMTSYIILKVTRPEMPRPYTSPLGIPGAAAGAVLSLLALAACFASKDMRPGVMGVAVFLIVAIGYFLIYSRHRLVAQAPEEEDALIAAAEKELVQE